MGALLVAAGVLLATQAPDPGPYGLRVLPSVLVVALGMACAAALLSAAILGAVDEGHVGVASGLNSAVAQLGGAIAIALIGAVLSQRGAGLATSFRIAATAGSVLAVAAAACVALPGRARSSAG